MAIDWRKRKYTQEEFIAAWEKALCLSDVVRTLYPDIKQINGGNINVVSNTAIALGLTRDHFDIKAVLSKNTLESHRLGKFSESQIPLSEILVENSTYHSSSLKKRLLDAGLLSPVCENPNCYVREDCRYLVPITLDHINGVNSDNRIENLRILCYNCHGLTDTYCGRNRSVVLNRSGAFLTYAEITGLAQKNHKEIERIAKIKAKEKAAREKVAYIPPTKIQYPDVEEIIAAVENIGSSKYSKILGVSDNAIRKYLKRMGVNSLPRWQSKTLLLSQQNTPKE